MCQKSRPQHRPGPTPRLQQALQAIAREPCLLCGAPSTVGGVFTPDDPQRYGAPGGAPPGARPAFVYPLCTPCYERADTCDRVEAVLLAKVRRQQALWN